MQSRLASHQYPIIRPAVIAVIQHNRDMQPATASCERSRADGSRVALSLQAVSRVKTATFVRPSAIAGNLMYMNGLPMYSVALVASRQTPLAAATAKPATAMGTAGSEMAERP